MPHEVAAQSAPSNAADVVTFYYAAGSGMMGVVRGNALAWAGCVRDAPLRAGAAGQ